MWRHQSHIIYILALQERLSEEHARRPKIKLRPKTIKAKRRCFSMRKTQRQRRKSMLLHKKVEKFDLCDMIDRLFCESGQPTTNHHVQYLVFSLLFSPIFFDDILLLPDCWSRLQSTTAHCYTLTSSSFK